MTPAPFQVLPAGRHSRPMCSRAARLGHCASWRQATNGARPLWMPADSVARNKQARRFMPTGYSTTRRSGCSSQIRSQARHRNSWFHGGSHVASASMRSGLPLVKNLQIFKTLAASAHSPFGISLPADTANSRRRHRRRCHPRRHPPSTNLPAGWNHAAGWAASRSSAGSGHE